MRRLDRSAWRRPYWTACQNMDFGELREFIDDSLQKPPMFGEGPRTRDDLLGLLEMLARKGGVEWTRKDGKCTWGAKACRKYRELLVEQERVQRALSNANRNVPDHMRARGETTKKVMKARRRLMVVRQQIAQIERQQEGAPEKPSTEARTEKQRRADRRRIVARIFGDIGRTFSADSRHSGSVQELRGAVRLRRNGCRGACCRGVSSRLRG